MSERFYIGGKQSVLSALNNPRRQTHEVFLTKNDNGIKFSNIKIVQKHFFNKIFNNRDVNHQNIAAIVSPLKPLILKEEIKKNNLNKIVILNGISDQRNIGSIIRTALGLGFDGIILEKKFFNQKNPIMIKASSGAIEHLKFFLSSNIKNDMKVLKKENYSIVGLDSSAKKNLETFSYTKKFALIFGSEGEGIKSSVLANCDEVLKVRMNDKIQSLNVSNAVAAVLASINIILNK